MAPRYAEPLNGLGTLAVERDQPRATRSPTSIAPWRSLPATRRCGSTAPSPCELAGDAAAAAAAYRDFLRATDREPRQFAEQRQAARQFLDQLSRAAAAPPARHPAGGR